MKKSIQSIVTLTLICVVISALLAAVNFVTAPIIEKAEAQKANEALLVVMPNGKDFKELSVSDYELPSSVVNLYSEESGGYIFKMVTTGYSSGLTVMCGIDKDGKVTDAVCLASGETLGYEKTYGENFKGLDSSAADGVDTISGATNTTSAYKNAIKDALNSFIIVNGGSVDIRTEEEILADNLSVALPNGANFAKEFITEVLDGVSAIYKAGNGEGFVVVSGEKFIGIDKSGNALGENDEEIKALALSALEKHKNSTHSEIDISSYEGISERIEKAYKTKSGNYIFELLAAGYGINGNYHASGEYIRIKVSATQDGKIISCLTVSQSETDGVGSECAKPSYYEQYNGKTENTMSEVDTIGGATLTSRGYSTAVSKVFEAIKILKGAN